jgi:hypothetical protein
LIYPETTPVQIIQATYTLSTSLIAHFNEITSNEKSHYHSLPDPTHAIESIFSLLGTVYSSPKLTTSQRSVISEIIIEIVGKCLSIIDTSCILLIKNAIYNDSQHGDYRGILATGILGLCLSTNAECPLRQSLLLRLLLEMRDLRCLAREGRVAVLARDEMLWYLLFMVEHVIVKTGRVGELVKREAGRVVWDTISGARDEGVTKGNWIAWRTCDLICGVGGLQMVS